MFEVRVFCEDKKLPELLWALDGKIVGMPQLLPVRDAKPSKDGSKVVGTAKLAYGEMITLLNEALNSRGLGGKITRQEVIEILRGAGARAKTPLTLSSNYLFKRLKEGVVKRAARGQYIIMKESKNEQA